MTDQPESTGRRMGATIGPYLLHEEIGRGGMGVVYRATRLDTGLEAAVKLMLPELSSNARFRERFIEEAQTAPKLDHLNIVPVYEAGEVDAELYIAMQLVHGPDLKQVIGREGNLDPRRVVSVLGQVSAALDYAHGTGVVHRDVKPQNILLSQPGGSTEDLVYVTDFGLVKPVGSESTASRTGEVFGSIQYMAPEQIEAMATDGRADVYSLACVAFEALTGQIPFERPNEVAVLWAHVHEDPPRVTDVRPDLPGGLDIPLANAMAKHPDDRYLTCGEFTEALEAGLAQRRRVATMPLVKPLVARVPRKKTEREVWAPNYFPELSRVRKLTDKPNWARSIAVTAILILALAGVTQLAHPQGLVGAAKDVVEVADTVIQAVTNPGSAPELASKEIKREARVQQSPRGSRPAIAGSDQKQPRTVHSSKREQPSLVQSPPAAAQEVGPNEIVFSSNEGGDRELYKTVSGGSGLARLTKNKVDDENPSWSPDGSMIAFTRTYPGPKSELWVMRQDGTQPRLVLTLGNSYAFEADLSWSPDGKRILYSQDGIFVVNLDGTGNSKLVGPEGSGPEWSPDGTRIVFSKSSSTTTTESASASTPLWIMNPDGSGQEQLTNPSDASGGKFDSSPTWTPDGSQIAFVRGNGLGVFAGDTAQVRAAGIFLINADGSGLLRVSEGRGEFDPSASPSGDQFVYVGGDDGTGDGDLYLIRADGSGKARLTTGGRSASPDWRWPPS